MAVKRKTTTDTQLQHRVPNQHKEPQNNNKEMKNNHEEMLIKHTDVKPPQRYTKPPRMDIKMTIKTQLQQRDHKYT